MNAAPRGPLQRGMRLSFLGLALLLLGVALGLTASERPAGGELAPPRPSEQAGALDPVLVSRPAEENRVPVPDAAAPAPSTRRVHSTPPGSIPARSDDAVLLGLRWLAAHQAADGSWAPESDPRACAPARRPAGEEPPVPQRVDFGLAEHRVAVTSFALLAFLGAGYTHRGDHEFARVVRSAGGWLRAHQEHGFVRATTHPTWMFDHAVATWALWVLYGMTESPIYLQPALESLGALVRQRGPRVWTYGVGRGLADESLTLWALLSLLDARAMRDDLIRRERAPDWALDEPAIEAGLAWLERVTEGVERPENLPLPLGGDDDLPGSEPRAFHALGLLLRAHACQDLKEERFAAARAWLVRDPPAKLPGGGTLDLLHAWAGAHAAFVAQREPWKAWDAALSTQVLPAQSLDGLACDYRGSFAPGPGAVARGGRALATALGVLAFELYYRYDTQLLPCR